MKLRALALMVVAATAQAAPPTVDRLMGSASVVREGSEGSLRAGDALKLGDLVKTGNRSRLAAKLDNGTTVTLAGLSEVQLQRLEVEETRFLLTVGAGRVRRTAVAPFDLVLYAGTLKASLNAPGEIWAASTIEGDLVCLLSGETRIDVQDSTKPEFIDKAGECLRRAPEGINARLTVNSDRLIQAAVEATKVPGDLTAAVPPPSQPMSPPAPAIAAPIAAPIAANPLPVVSTSAPSKAVTPAGLPQKTVPAPQPPVIAAAPVPAVAAAIPPTKPTVPSAPGDDKDYAVVVFSSPNLPEANRNLETLRAKGFVATLRTATVNGKTTHRVCVGKFATAEEARAYRNHALKAIAPDAWVLTLD